MSRTISQLILVVPPSQVWLKRQSVCSTYCAVGGYGGVGNDLFRVITHNLKCTVLDLHEATRKVFQRSSKGAVVTCSGIKDEKMAPTRVILMSCGSYNPPTNMHLRMFGTYISFLVIDSQPSRKYETIRYTRDVAEFDNQLRAVCCPNKSEYHKDNTL